ncbi:SH3 domain-containing protein [Streptomyces sp. JJ66]|uniref:SH3 domain-containing protein n=1 Tax=Streptomyces sp. JJ66 TaxID=2803843 RepID=UPI001C58BD44|nr:SH3 domain-containing protein [Streptomyces sp. JJ66]MBW1602214.1 SH3 domain-containing protein [Streptomyces sp. JJ66]
MLKSAKTAAALAAGALALGVLGAAPTLAADEGPEVAKSNAETMPAQKEAADHSEVADASHIVYGRVVARTAVNIRSKPTTHSKVLGSYRHGAKIALDCKVRGQNVNGNNIWYKLYDRHAWVTARYVKNLDYVPWCH